MRLSTVVLLCGLATGAWAQLRPAETKVLDDALTLANLRPVDLGGVMPPTGARAAQVEALKDPLAGLAQAAARHEFAPSDEVSLLRTALGLVDGKPERGSDGAVAELPASVPGSLRRPVGRLVAAIARANDEIRASLTRLKPEERRALIEGLPRLALDDPSLSLDFGHGPTVEFATLHRLLDRVNTQRIEAAGLTLATVVRETIPSLQAVPKRPMAKLLFRTRGVLVELSGSEPDIHDRRDVGLCVDLGGDDRYLGRYGAGIGYASVLIDLTGNDRYLGPDANYGAGILGIGLAYDLGGDDVYGVRNVGLGCGLAGVGLLHDASGDDRYRVVALGLGAGVRGIGILDDRLGDDAYEVGQAGEGYGALRGVGWSVDGAGNDVYRGGEWVQATGRTAGFGLLTDAGGDDTYRCVSGQAAAFGGYASLGDLRGDDSYVAVGRAQGFASDGGFAALVDDAGDDSYLLRRGPGQAAAFGAVAILADRGGDDEYGGTDGTPATALGGGVAILLDSEGDDRYLASASFRKEADGVALWADGGGRDRYGDGREDAQATAGMDVASYDAFGAADTVAPRAPLPPPGSIPMPSDGEFGELRRRAADGPDAVGAIARLVGIGLPALQSLAAEPDDTFVAVAARLGPAAAPVVARMVASSDPRVARAAMLTAGFVPLPPEALVAALGRPEIARDAAVAAGRARLTAAVPALTGLAASNDLPMARAAIEALALIGDPAGASTASALIDSPDLAVRRAAFRLLATQASLAYTTGTRLVASSDGFHQRIGLALLGRVGTPQALTVMGASLRGSRDAKIGALLALDGRVPTELIVAVEALRRDADPLVRAVAERTDVGP